MKPFMRPFHLAFHDEQRLFATVKGSEKEIGGGQLE